MLHHLLQEISVLIMEDVEPFVGMGGESLGPYHKGDSVVMDRRVAEILVGGQKAIIV